MSYEKYIYKLLLENDTVIIPGLGAFTSEYQPAEINEKSDEIKPPSKKISFTKKIRNNDGLFVGYVAENKGISHFEALKRIENERDDMLYRLDNGKEIEIPNVGILSYNEKGKLKFKETYKENISLETFGLETTSLLEEPETDDDDLDNDETEEDIVTEETINEPEEIPEEQEPGNKEGVATLLIETETPPVEEEPKTEERNTNQEDVSEEAEKQQTNEEAEENTEEETTCEIKKEEIVEPDKTQEDSYSEEKQTPIQTDDDDDDEPFFVERKRKGWWFLLLLIPILAVIVFFLLRSCDNNVKLPPFLDKIIDKPQKEIIKKDVPAADSTIVADTTLADSAIVDSSTISTKTDPIAVEKNDFPIYYLVGGGFSSRENADKFIAQLKGKGYDASYIGKKGRLHLVAIGTYKTLNEAKVAKWEYASKNSKSESWIYKKTK